MKIVFLLNGEGYKILQFAKSQMLNVFSLGGHCLNVCLFGFYGDGCICVIIDVE